jgi:hypothetical protein
VVGARDQAGLGVAAAVLADPDTDRHRHRHVGDPLDVASVARQVWLGGQANPMRSRQTELRDRYLHADTGLPRAYPEGAR